MSDFVTQMMYDQGIYDAVEHDEPLFSKPIWKHLIHKTRTPDDRTRILSSRSFNPATNPNITAGIYTRPDVWMDDEMPPQDQLIQFCTRQCRFTHNGADRPMDAMMGLGSVWWNRLWCAAADEIGFSIKPTLRASDYEWLKENRRSIDEVVHQNRHPFMQAVNQRIHGLNIDILGQGGEFIIMNQGVVDWERTREASGFETAHRRRFNAAKAKMEDFFEDFRSLIFELRSKGDQIAMASVKPVVSANAVIVYNIMMAEETCLEFLHRAVEIATKHDLRLGLTRTPFEMGDKTPADFGFIHEKGSGLFQ